MFRFPLESLLNHRRLLEEERQKELAALEARRLEAVHHLEALARARRRWEAEWLRTGVPTSGGLLAVGERYRKRLDREAAEVRRRLQEAQRSVEAKRRELIEAVQRRKIIEKLKEKEMQRYRASEARKERNFLGEMAVTRFRR